jgi:hypothetical protein
VNTYLLAVYLIVALGVSAAIGWLSIAASHRLFGMIGPTFPIIHNRR